MAKDQELRTFASGTRRFPANTTTLSEALKILEKKIRARPYIRSQEQIDAAKRLSDRIMGESSE